MRAPTIKEILFAALSLALIGWISTFRKLNSPELATLERQPAVPLTSLPEKYFPRHQPQEMEACFTLINNGLYDVFLAFNAFEISDKHGSRMIAKQNAMVFPAAKDEGSLSAAYQFCTFKEVKDSYVVLSIFHLEAMRHETLMASAGTAVNASAFCLCPPETTTAVTKNQKKRQLVLETCKNYEVLFHSSASGLCGFDATKDNKSSLRGGDSRYEKPKF